MISALPRFHDLGLASLSSDEDYTHIVANSVLAGTGARMPSGMPYRRALPFSGANAAAVAILGAEDNASYRVVAAISGSLAPAALFLTGTAFAPAPVALVAASMLSLSEWHVAQSRYGRMYSPLLLTFLLSAYLFWRWSREGGPRLLAGAIAAYALTVSLHLLGLPAPETALFAIALPGVATIHPVVVLTAVGAAVGALYALNQVIVQRPYGEWSIPADYPLEGLEAAAPVARAYGLEPILVGLGLLLGIWLGTRLDAGSRADGTPIQRLAAGAAIVVSCALAMNGHLWGATLAAAVMLLLRPTAPAELVRLGGAPLIAAVAVALTWIGYAVSSGGFADGIRRVAGFPFPYPVVLWAISPAVVVLFLLGSGLLAFGKPSDETVGLRCAALAAWVPIAGLGFASTTGPPRYLFMIYPFVLLVVAYVLVASCRVAIDAFRRSDQPHLAPALAIALVAAGVVWGHGLRQTAAAVRVDYSSRLTPPLADHETPGRFVSTVRQAGDVVIAEDVTIAYVYAGAADYWFRRADDARTFLFLGEDGVVRDKYAGAELLPTVASLELAVERAGGRVWFLASRETWLQPEFYLTPEQAAWLDRLRVTTEPASMGADGVTAAYCLNC